MHAIRLIVVQVQYQERTEYGRMAYTYVGANQARRERGILSKDVGFDHVQTARLCCYRLLQILPEIEIQVEAVIKQSTQTSSAPGKIQKPFLCANRTMVRVVHTLPYARVYNISWSRPRAYRYLQWEYEEEYAVRVTKKLKKEENQRSVYA